MGFKENVRKLRKSRDMTQDELAVVLDVDRSAVSQWEAGTSYLRMSTAIELVQFFGVGLDEIMSDDLDINTGGIEELIRIYESIDDASKEKLVSYARFLSSQVS